MTRKRPAACLLDVVMPQVDGLELQASLRAAGCPLPIVFLTGSADIPMSVRAMKAGAVNLLTKPVEELDAGRGRDRSAARRRGCPAGQVA